MNIFVCVALIIMFKVRTVFPDFNGSKKDIAEHFNLIVSVAKFYEAKAILVLFDDQSESQVIAKLLRRTNFYFSIVDANKFKEIKFGHERVMAICYSYYAKQCGCFQNVVRNLTSEFHRVFWLVMCRHFPDNTEGSYIPFNCQFLIAEDSLTKNEFVITELYQFSTTSRLYSSVVGSWRVSDNLNMINSGFFERRSNFWKEDVRIVPYIPDTTGAASALVPYYVPGIWWAMEQRLNATTRQVKATDKYDLGVNINHAHGYQPLPVMMNINSRLFYKRVTGDPSLSSYFQPFDWNVWLSTLGFIIISSATMVIVNKFRIFLNENYDFFLLDAFYIFLQQGTQISDNRSSFFMIKSLQLFLSALIFLYYGSVLISFITVVVSKPPFTNLEGILENGRYNILAIEGRGRVIFQQSPGIVKELYIKHVSPVEDSPKTFFEAFYRVCFGKQKLLTECAINLAPRIVSALPKPCRVANVPFTTLKRTFEMQDNRFEEIFRVCITKLLESEAIGNIFWKKALGLVETETKESFESISFGEVSSLFLIFAIGVSLTLILFILELFNFKRETRP